MKKFSLLPLFIVWVAFYSCVQEQLEPGKSIEVSGGENAVFPYYFDWEDPNLNEMPYPSVQKIEPPWTGQGSLFGIISEDVLNDRKNVDGWELIYNTFHPSQLAQNPYFILYNKYRGLLRMYMFVNNLGSFASSSYLQDGLFLGNSNYALLNFAETEVVDVTQNAVRVDRVHPKPYNGPPLANDRWYFMQYEIAYDASMVPVVTNPPQISYYFNSINIEQISLGGTIQGEVKGTIGASQKTAGQNIWSAATPGLKTLGSAGLSAVGVQSINDNTQDSNGSNKFGIKATIWKRAKIGLENAISSGIGNIPGTIYNVLSAVIGGSSVVGGQTANLTIGGVLQLDGSITNTGSLPSSPGSFIIPGSVKPDGNGVYQVQGYVPLYNKKLGIFNLANKPTVNVHITRSPAESPLYIFDAKYTIKAGTLNLQWNPVVNGESADIVNQKTEIIALFPNDHHINIGRIHFQGREENVLDRYSLSGPSGALNTINKHHEIPIECNNRILVRVSFVVNPKNGGAPSAIVKTFDANIERTYSGF